ncbi:sulfoquinovose isomerase [Fictibacillus phosphorivorans]|uniref:sulfoquinovose isomerase n=1 Tax=Fictibacillus phosphorivorans TaxID=1221500 RepID=UPI0035E95811
MQTPTIVYIPIGRKTFDLEAGEQYRKQSSEWLNKTYHTVYEPEEILTSVEDLQQFLETLTNKNIDSIIYQSVTFADGEFIAKVLQYRKEPVVVWSVREPSVGGRLRLNSLTGGNSTSNVLMHHRHPFTFVLGNPDEEQLQKQLSRQIRVNVLVNKLKQLKIGVIGEHPPGFFFSDTDEELLHQKLGVTVQKMDLLKAFQECVELPEEEWAGAIDRAEQQVIGLNRSDETVKKFAQFSTYVKKYIEQEDIAALAVRCWPEFFNELGAAACSTLSQFTEDGVVSSCESDIHGAVSMFILQELSGGNAPYLGDLVHVNEPNNSVVFWHCGAGAYSLASPSTGAQSGVHPNRKMGFTMDFGLKAGEVTIFRLGYTPDGYRLLVMKGEALDVPQPFSGTSVEVRLNGDVSETVNALMESGYEPHFAVVYADVAEDLLQLGKQLNIPTEVYV